MELIEKRNIINFCNELNKETHSYSMSNFILQYFELPLFEKPVEKSFIEIKNIPDTHIETFKSPQFHENEFPDEDWVQDGKTLFENDEFTDDKSDLDSIFNHYKKLHKNEYENCITGFMIENWDVGGNVFLPFLINDNNDIIPHPEFLNDWNVYDFKKNYLQNFRDFNHRTLYFFSKKFLIKNQSTNYSYEEDFSFLKNIDLFNSLNENLIPKNSIKRLKI